MAKSLRILLFDIETAPLMAHAWQAKTRYLGHHQIIHDTWTLTWAAKWADEDEILSDSVTPSEAIKQDDTRIVLNLAKLMREADILIAHNIDRFDLPMVRNRLLLLDQEPLGPVKTLDTCKLAKRTFRLASVSLDYLARMLGLETKLATDYQLWMDCIHGEEEALERMLEYNLHDVTVLQQVYERLLPHLEGVPRLVEATEGEFEHVCPTCGSVDLQKRGYYRTKASTFQRWWCKDCGRWSRSRSSEKHLRVATNPL